MGILTTQSVGFGEPKPEPDKKADPKPVTGINYAGVPMREGEYYNGRPEHMGPEQQKTESPSDATERPTPFYVAKHERKTRRGKFQRSPEYRARMRDKARAWWEKKKQQNG